ncbi:MAG: RNA polymerase factor sigma-54 [Phycisphaerae bacterium]
MSQILSQVPRHLLLQQQRLTPQLIQAMDILQLPVMALEARISQEIDGNPALEFAVGDDESSEAPAAESPRTDDDGVRNDQALTIGEGPQDFARLDSLVREYEWGDDDFEYRGARSRAASLEDSDQKMEAMANTAARPISLQELLNDQWRMADVDEPTREIGSRIIELLDDSGRLNTSLEQIGESATPPATLKQVEDALARVQLLEPPGVAARSLQECLLLQLEALPGDHELAYRVIEDHFEDLRRNRLPLIAKALGVDVAEIKQALHVVGRLSLHPGLEITDRHAPPIVPDVLVDYEEETDSYTVRLARSNARELRISPEFREVLERARDDKQARDFLKQKIEAANAIIEAVRYRRERLLDVAKAVVEAQRDFLDHGEQHLKVLRMSDLAGRFNCDPSTISRTVDEKYMQTPRGVFPLRRFFTGGAEAGNGEMLGWDSIRARVQEIVAEENKAAPLNDDEIVDRLLAAGIDIKRRTVAKYRSQLGIPTARQRKQY